MNKIKLLIILIISCLIAPQLTCAQVPKIKNNIIKLFFNIPKSPERFDIKLILNSSENFYDIKEFDYANIRGISSEFEENEALNYLGKQNHLSIYFKANGRFDQMAITSKYIIDDVNRCQEQISSLVSLFRILSYKTGDNASYDGDNKMIGRGKSFYSSLTSYKKLQPYLSISYSQRNNEDYILDIHYYPNHLY